MKRQLIKNLIYQKTLTKIPQYDDYSLLFSIKHAPEQQPQYCSKYNRLELTKKRRHCVTLVTTRPIELERPSTRIHFD